MANGKDVRVRPVPIQLDRSRTLHYDFNAFIELEEMYGDINKVFEGVQQQRLKPIRDMLWAGLVHEDEDLTPKDVGRMLNLQNQEKIAAKITLAMGISLPEPKEAPGKPGE